MKEAPMFPRSEDEALPSTLDRPWNEEEEEEEEEDTPDWP